MRRARWPRIGLTARARLATLVAAIVLGVVFTVLLRTVDVSRDRDSQARQSADAIEAANSIEGSVIDLETGLRGYIISGETNFLEPYQRARATQPQRLNTLERLVRDNRAQLALARGLRDELNSYANDYGVPLIAAVGAGRRIGVQRLAEGKARVDRIRKTLGRFTAAENRLQANRRAAARSAAHRARVFAFVGLGVLVLVVIVSGVYASRFVAEPLRRLARSARRLAAGKFDERVEVSGAAEVSDLGIAFNQMAESLEEHTKELERLSESSAAEFSAVFEQTPVGLTLFDRELRCLRSNPALGALAGVVASEQPGRTVSELFGNFDPDLTADFGRVLQTGQPVPNVRITGGDHRVCNVSLFPVRRRDGELIGVAAVVTDVTQREQRLRHERVTAERATQLERLTSSISEALTPEEITRAVVAEAVAVLGADGGVITLLDEERQALSMSAAIGWPLEEQEWFTRLPLTVSSPTTDAVRTRRTIHAAGPAAQPDAYPELAERRARHGIAASLALPLLSGPRVMGGLRVTFSEPREFDQDELEFAEDVAERCAAGVARALLYEREHATAAALQSSLMPRALPMFEGVVLGARFRPAGTGAVVGGDFYDVLRLGDEQFMAWIGDVQGKGPEAAAIAALARYTLRAEIRHELQPARLLQSLNEAVLAQSDLGDRLLTAICLRGEVKGDRLELEMAIAGHPSPLLVRRDQPCVEWGAPGPLIGFEHSEFVAHSIALEAGELLVLYTDGLTDAHAPQRFLRIDDLCRSVDALERFSLGEILDGLLARAGNAPDDVPRDDIALLGLAFAPRTARGAASLAETHSG
jgi:PAS domain S-box-containing protein